MKESELKKKTITLTKENIDDIKTVDRGYPEVKREGVFEHIFKCQVCGLEFKTYSWQEFRHTAKNTYCPECGWFGGKIHVVKTLSTEKVFNLFGKGEIFRHTF